MSTTRVQPTTGALRTGHSAEPSNGSKTYPLTKGERTFDALVRYLLRDFRRSGAKRNNAPPVTDAPPQQAPDTYRNPLCWHTEEDQDSAHISRH